MAIKRETIVKTQVFDDLDGKQLPEDAQPMRYQIQGKTYDLHFSEKNRQKFLDFIEKVTADAEIVHGATKRVKATKTPAKSDAKIIREWAAENGVEVPSRGRIPNDVRAQYDAAQSS